MLLEREKFSVHQNGDGITELKLNEACTIDMEDSKEMGDLIEKEFDGDNLLLLVVSGLTTSVTKASRDYSIKNPLKAKAMAIIARSLPQKVISNFIMVAYKKKLPKYPVKMFMNREKASAWLLKQK